MREVNLIRDLNIEKHIIYEGQDNFGYLDYKETSPVYGRPGPAVINYKTYHRIVPIVKFVQNYVDDFNNVGDSGRPVVRREETFIAITDNVEGCLGKILTHLDAKINRLTEDLGRSRKLHAEVSNMYVREVGVNVELTEELAKFKGLSFWNRLKFLFTGEL